ncbi:MAG: SRPBCC domain-containing protein, partial [Arenimonas sp.]
MKKPDYVYVSYIATTPEKVWQAFIDIDVMREYWVGPGSDCSRINVSDWKPGSKWEHQRTDGSGIVDILGKVVEFTPPRRMVLTWAR